MTVRDLTRKLSSAELTEWISYSRLRPFGPLVNDQRYGNIMALIANVHRDPSKMPEPFSPTDFMMSKVKQRKEVQSWEEQLSVVEMLTTALGGKDLRKKN